MDTYDATPKLFYWVKFLGGSEPTFKAETSDKILAVEIAKEKFQKEYGYWPNQPVLVY